MSKYIIELNDDVQIVQKVGVTNNGNAFSIGIYKDILEQYTPVDVEKVYDKAYSDGYNKVFVNGKAVHGKGCEGCRFEGIKCAACKNCCNSYMNHWTAKDDKIEVGDEVNLLGDCFIVTRIFQPRTQKEQCDGIDDDGCVYRDILMDDLEKTGRHFDIASILEAMKHD